MKVNRRDVGDVVILDIKGHLDGDPKSGKHATVFETIASEGKKKVIVNLEDVRTIGPKGIGLLLEGWKTMEDAFGELVLVNASGKTHGVFETARARPVFRMLGTEKDALRYFSLPRMERFGM